jgi:hypothetical protein
MSFTYSHAISINFRRHILRLHIPLDPDVYSSKIYCFLIMRPIAIPFFSMLKRPSPGNVDLSGSSLQKIGKYRFFPTQTKVFSYSFLTIFFNRYINGRIIKKQYIILEYTSGSNGICKRRIWRRKLIEMACEYTELLNPRWHMIRLYVLQLLLHQWFQIEKVYLYNVLIIWNLLLKMQVLKKRGLGARVVMFNANHGQTLSHNV